MFLSPLDIRVLDDSKGRPTYVLLARFGYFSECLRAEVWVPEGFETDLASVPALGMSLIGGQPGDRAAVIHDYLIASATVDRKTADTVFLEALRVCGVDENVAVTMYNAVSLYTAFSTPAVMHRWEDAI